MKLELLENKSSESIKEYTYRVLRQNIISLNLKPGETITENEIANSLNVSRTPIREAFAKLVGEQLLEVYPQKSTFVSLIDFKRVEEAQFMRVNLEEAIVKLACENFSEDVLFELESNLNQQQFCFAKKNYITTFDLDNEMHELIFKGCGKSRVWSAIRFMAGDFDRIRTLKLSSFMRWDEIIEQHRIIVKAIKNKDADLCARTMHEHIAQVKEDQIILKEKYPQYFK